MHNPPALLLQKTPQGLMPYGDRDAISPALLRQLLQYEPETGKLFWRQRPKEMFKPSGHGGALGSSARWNARYAGKEAFTADCAGYRRGSIFGVGFSAQRVIWAHFTGEWPTFEVDHQDRDSLNNRWTNLRHATPSQNSCNKGLRSDNSSGVKGVSYHKKTGKWQVNITVQGRTSYLGLFKDIEAAEKAVADARIRLHGEFGRAA